MCFKPSSVNPEESGNTETHTEIGAATTAGYRSDAPACIGWQYAADGVVKETSMVYITFPVLLGPAVNPYHARQPSAHQSLVG